MALAGLTPFVSTYGVFLAGRAWDQVRNTVCYNHLNVKLAGAHGGISVGPDGATHQALEDVALMRTLPGMTVVVPCDAIETYKATLALYDTPGPCYIRFGREAVPVVTDDDTPFVLGRNRLVQDGTDVVYLANGYLVHQAMRAAEKLAKEGIFARVVDVHTVKPLDREDVIRHASETGAVVVCEEHQINGGLCGAVCETIAESVCVPVERIGVRDSFGESGTPEELIEKYGLGVDALCQAARKAIARQ